MADLEAPIPPTDVPESVRKGLGQSVKYLVTTFLKDKHYSKIGGSLANRWDKFQSLTAAMKLMEQHGVVLDPQEEQRLSGMNEAQMIEALVMKMPQQSKEQFQHFFLQLQLIVSTATRVRQALEQGRDDLVEQAMDDAESTGIAQYILKMSIVQAGSEVNNLKKQHAAWVKDAEAKMSKLVKGQEDAIQAKERLDKAMGDLSMFQANQNENIKKVLMTFAGGSATALLHGCFSSWHNYVKKMKVENAIYEEYREEIEAAEQRLIDAKSAQLKSVKGMIEKKHAASGQSLVGEVFQLWYEEIIEKKYNAGAAAQVAAMEARLKACADHQAESAKKVMARCGAVSANGLRDMCFHEWVTFHQEYMKNKELEDAIKAEEAKIAAFKKKHSENAQGLLNNMHAATNTGLMHEVFMGWMEWWKDEKALAEMSEIMAAGQGKLGAFGDRNKKGARNACERAHEHNIVMLYLKVFGAWRLDTQIEKTLRKHQNRIQGKRDQLLGVQQMFRNFAQELEKSMESQNRDDSISNLKNGPPAGFKRSKGKNDGAVSLPDIHQKPGYGSQRSSGRKEAWN